MKNGTIQPEILALIPARGGSMGIPYKNLIQLAGRPCIAYSIEHAQRADHITRVIVSTDDEKIASVAQQHGAEIPFMRPAEFAQNSSPDIDVFRHAISWLQENEGYCPELVVHLRPTGPVRRIQLIEKAIRRMLQNPEADSLRSVSWPIQTPYKMWRIGENGYLDPLLRVERLPDAHSMPRQILPEVFWQNGYVDIIRPRAILQQNSMCGSKVLPFVVQDPIYELDYPESIPEVERALKRLARREPLADMSHLSLLRHPV